MHWTTWKLTVKKNNNIMAPFYGCVSTASRLEPLWAGSLDWMVMFSFFFSLLLTFTSLILYFVSLKDLPRFYVPGDVQLFVRTLLYHTPWSSFEHFVLPPATLVPYFVYFLMVSLSELKLSWKRSSQSEIQFQCYFKVWCIFNKQKTLIVCHLLHKTNFYSACLYVHDMSTACTTLFPVL